MDLIEREPSPDSLWKTDEGFDDLFANNPLPMWVYDKETLAFLEVNDAAVDLYGYSRDEFLALRITDIRPPEDVAALQALVDTPTPPFRHAGEWRHLTKDGRLLNVLITTHLVNYAGRPAGFVLVNDVTESREAERRLEASEQRYKSLFEHSRDAITMVDLEGRLTSVNPAAERLTGYTAQELIGSPFWRVLPPDDQAPMREAFARNLDKPSDLEGTVVRSDGSHVAVHMSKVPVTVGGNLVGMYAVVRDISEQKRADAMQQALLERVHHEHQRLDDLVRNVPGVVWEVWFQPDPTRQRINYVSQHVEAMLGYPVERWMQDPHFWLTVVHPDDRDRADAEAWEHIRSGEGGTSQFRCVAQDGRIVWVETRSACIFDDDGRLIGMRGVNMDITDRKQAHAALLESEKRFRLLAENATDFISRHTMRGSFIYASPSIRSLCGYEPEDLLGRRTFEFIHPDDLPTAWKSVTTMLEGAGVATMSYRFRHKNGTYIWLETACHIVLDPATEETAEIQAVSRDITARKEAEEALRLSEERYRFVERATDDVIWDWDLVTGEMRHSDSLKTVFGYDVQDIVRDGQWWYDRAHPEDRDRVVEDMWSAVHSGNASWTGEYRFARRDGTWATVMDRSYVIRSSTGVPLRMIGSMADITKRKRNEDTLRFLATASETLSASLDYHTTLSNLARAAIPFLADYCVIDMFEEDGSARRLAMNHCDPAKEKILRSLQARLFTGARKPHPMLQAMLDGKPQMVAELGEQSAQSWKDFPELEQTFRVLGTHSYMGVPLHARGRVIGAIAFVSADSGHRYNESDLELATEVARRASVAIDNARLYREIQRADLAKEEFLAMLGHELRNPLGAISNALQLIHLRDKVDPSLQRTLEVVDRQTHHMARLVEDLLDVSRITQGKIELRPEPTLLSSIIEQAVQIVEPLINSCEHRLTVQLPGEPVWLDVDAIRIAQVISNLLNNAAKYTEPGGDITLSAERDGPETVIRVRDTGVGIAPDLLPKVFDLFTQADRGLDRSQGGLGIGLTVVRNLVEIHGGTVEADSEGPGKGSLFTLRLPAMADKGEEPEHKDGPPATEAPAAIALRILLVEDNVDAARTLSEILSMWGYDVRLAHDGLTALDVACKHETDVVLLDIGLPGMDGYEVARRMRSEGLSPNAHLVALTGYGQDEDQRRSFDAGFNDHLVKPVDFTVLQHLLESIRA